MRQLIQFTDNGSEQEGRTFLEHSGKVPLAVRMPLQALLRAEILLPGFGRALLCRNRGYKALCQSGCVARGIGERSEPYFYIGTLENAVNALHHQVN